MSDWISSIIFGLCLWGIFRAVTREKDSNHRRHW